MPGRLVPPGRRIPVWYLVIHVFLLAPLAQRADAPHNRQRSRGVDVTGERAFVTRYSREDVLRILRIRANQLRAWERFGLIDRCDSYGLREMAQLRKLRDLRAANLSTARIRASVDAMQSVSGLTNPLLETGVVPMRSGVAFRLSGAMVDPIARQFVFDFDSRNADRLAEVDDYTGAHSTREARIARLFMAAVEQEERGSLDDAAALYEDILALDECHAPACINLGTILYNRREFPQAEQLYRRATLADPNYALAFFDLGNVLDELRRLPEAIESYRRAIHLAPAYADAHYNLALAYERSGEPRPALRHWNCYVRLDPSGPWAHHARAQARKILQREKLAIVHSASPLRRERKSPSTGLCLVRSPLLPL
jgi:tetratricopeptide (TPR) repeat protein